MYVFLLFHLLIRLSFISSMAKKLVLISSWSQVASDGFKSIIKNAVSIGEDTPKLLYVPTAKYVYDQNNSKSRGEQRRRARYDAKQKLRALADELHMSECQILELDAPTLSTGDITAALRQSNILYMDGGNTFYLQHHLLRSAFWPSFKEHMATTGNYVYIGVSAGAIVAGNSIETAYWKGWDDPTASGTISEEWTVDRKEGAKLAPDESFFMHYDADIHQGLVEESSRRFEGSFLVRTVKNNNALIYGEDEKANHSNNVLFTFENIFENNLES